MGDFRIKKLFQDGIFVLLGGALGVLARFFVSLKLETAKFSTFPVSTLIVNLTGCLIAGALFGLLREKMTRFYKTFIFIGFLGSYTTYSEFALRTSDFILEGHFKEAFLNIILTIFAGFFIFIGAYYFGKKLR